MTIGRSWATGAPIPGPHSCTDHRPLALVHLDGDTATVEPAPDSADIARRVLRGALTGPADSAPRIARVLRDAGLGVVVSKPVLSEAEALDLLARELGATILTTEPRARRGGAR